MYFYIEKKGLWNPKYVRPPDWRVSSLPIDQMVPGSIPGSAMGIFFSRQLLKGLFGLHVHAENAHADTN